MKLPINQIICGAMPEATKGFPDGSINCCISSPPYWALRDYGVDGQLGLEKTFEEYIDKLCTIYDEVKRVLRPDGTCWVNLGDTYGGASSRASVGGRAGYGTKREGVYSRGQEKSLCLIPQRFAIEMVNRGWILRNVIIWHKPNPMPSSAKDRFTVDFEYVYFFVKSRKYWFEPQYEPYQECSIKRIEHGWKQPIKLGETNDFKKSSMSQKKDGFNQYLADNEVTVNPLGRNKRTVWTIPNDGGLYIEDPKIIAEFTEWLKTRYPQQHAVWTIPTQSFPEAHFATFPEKLVEPMIKAGCPAFVCTKCGKAREKIYEIEIKSSRYDRGNKSSNFGIKQDVVAEHHFKGYTDCGCNADWRPGIVWDCFCWLWHDVTGSCKAAA